DPARCCPQDGPTKQSDESRISVGAGPSSCAVGSMFAKKKEQERMGSVRVAVVGVGNCAVSHVQGVHYDNDAAPDTRVPGLMHVQFGPYHVSDIECGAAFDVDAKKVGQDLSSPITASENNTIKICDVPPAGLTVL